MPRNYRQVRDQRHYRTLKNPQHCPYLQRGKHKHNDSSHSAKNQHMKFSTQCKIPFISAVPLTSFQLTIANEFNCSSIPLFLWYPIFVLEGLLQPQGTNDHEVLKKGTHDHEVQAYDFVLHIYQYHLYA